MRIMKQLLPLLVLTATVSAQLEVTLTRGDQASLLEARPDLTLAPGNGSHALKVVLDPTVRYQPIDGFGAALTDSSAWVLQNTLTPSERAALLDELFLADGGIGLNMLRIPMGASDFALTPYTYDDVLPGASDPNLAMFSIGYDWNHIIPTLLEIDARVADLKLIGTPWSPPAWMKTSGTLFGGSIDTQWLATYAEYFARFILAYEAAGLPIWAVTPQNEPLNDSSGLPSMSMPTFTQSAFVGDHLGPLLASVAPQTKIIVYDHNWDAWNYPLIVFNDPEAGAYADGASFHGYGGVVENQSLLHDFRPDKEIHFFEISGGDWSTAFDNNLVWFMRNIVIGTTRNWSRSALYWNLVLNENDGPYIPGGCQNCRGVVTVNSVSGAVTREVEYYGLAHASKFVRPGAVRIDSTTFAGEIETVAFRNPDCSEVLIAMNPQSGSEWFDIVRGGQAASYRLTGRSVATFVYHPPALDLDGDGLETGADALAIAACGQGPDVGVLDDACLELLCSDPDADGDLDLHDLALMQVAVGS